MHSAGTTPQIDWLLNSPPWAAYCTWRDILGQSDSGDTAGVRAVLLTHPLLKKILAELSQWPGRPLKNHKDAGHPIHQLTFLADLGFTCQDPPVAGIAERILALRSKQGPFQVLVNIPPRFGGTGRDQPAWMLCDAPLILYALVRLGLGDDPRVQSAMDHLLGLARPEGGWPCAVCPELGRFRGPGRKDDPCPYATLLMLKALGQFSAWRDHPACLAGMETLLQLWTQRRERRPYLFAMGTDFAKLKAPLIWYDILHVVEVLSWLPAARSDPRFAELYEGVKSKFDAEGKIVPDSVWRAWKEWDFGQKREPSPWLTFLVLRLGRRLSDTGSH